MRRALVHRRCALPIAALLGLAFAATEARAESQSFASALDDYQRGELDQALEGFEAALASGSLSPEDLVTVYLHLGVLRGATGDVESARRAFDAALALNPALPPPSELGGQLRALFDDIRAARRNLALRITSQETDGPVPPGTNEIAIAVENAPPGLVHRLGARVGSGFSRTFEGTGPFTVAFDAEAFAGSQAITVQIEARDRAGNYLSRAELELRPRAPLPEPDDLVPPTEEVTTAPEGDEVTPTPRRRWPWYRHPAFWVVVGCVLAGGVATGVVLGTRDQTSEHLLGAPTIR